MAEANALRNMARKGEGGREGGHVPIEEDAFGRLDADAVE